MQPGASYRLVVRRGPQPNQQYDLTRETLTIGRDITNDIVINDPECSRHHSRLVRNASGYTIEDLRSTNGTFINRQRISAPYQLTNGDLIGLGETVTLVFEVVGAYPAAQTAIGVAPSAPAYQQPAPPPAYQQPMPASPPPAAYSPAPPPMPPMQQQDEEVAIDRNRLIIIGCAALTVVFCCALVGAVIFIDQYAPPGGQAGDLWCAIPLLNQIFDCGF